MNITSFNTGMHTSNQGRNSSIYAGNLHLMQHTTLKSTQDKLERQQNTQNQVAYWEQQKENLKNMECSSIEEIARKLEMFHSYEDEIAAARMKYNSEQMWHIMDEARELGEKIAKEAEKLEPKTAEERRKEMAEEALGIDDSKGELTESMEEIQEEMEELQEEMQDEIGESAEQTIEELAKQTPESGENPNPEQTDVILEQEEQKALEEQAVKYKRIDVMI